MRFFIGALALAVICAVFGSPAVVLMGWRPLTVGDKQIIGTKLENRLQATAESRTKQ